MNTFPEQSFKAWKIIICFLYGVAVTSTAVRIWFRYRPFKQILSSSWKWDDILAVLASVLGIVAAVVQVHIYQAIDLHERIAWQTQLYWVMSASWVSIIWLSRIGLVLTLIRTTPPQSSLRRSVRGLLVSFFVMYLGHGAWFLGSGCTHSGKMRSGVRTLAWCDDEKQGVDIVGFVLSFTSEIALIAASTFVYVDHSRTSTNRVEPQKHSRSRAMSIRSIWIGALFMILIAIAHCSFHYSPLVSSTDGLLVVDMMAQLQAIVSILALNLPALVGLFRWVAYHETHFDLTGGDSPSGVARSTTNPSTGLEINVITLTDLVRDREGRKGDSLYDDDASSIGGYSSMKVKALPAALMTPV